jgi:CRISPR system Cascade subunit CasD
VTVLALRLSAPLQSWSGYRLAVSKDAVVPTESMPRKSGINGLIGAAVGSRDLDEIGAGYDLYVRTDHTNPTTEDYQTLGPLPGYLSADHPGRPTALADRAEKIRTATASARLERNRDGGSFPTAISRKDYLALRAPVFMTYLGRKSCPPTFPFLLGLWEGSAHDLFAQLPHVTRARSDKPPRAYQVVGSYDEHEHIRLDPITPPSADRKEQLAWLSQHLSR